MDTFAAGEPSPAETLLGAILSPTGSCKEKEIELKEKEQKLKSRRKSHRETGSYKS